MNLIILCLLATTGDQTVSGYTRESGTHVESYQRTEPNGTTYDNYSAGQYNPSNPSVPSQYPGPSQEGNGIYFTGE